VTPAVLTIGHGTAGSDELIALLQAGGADVVVDVRRFPGSRRSPPLGKVALAESLATFGTGYLWLEDLGGRRSVPPDNPDTWWTVPAFRGYAAHMRTPAFPAAVDRLLAAGNRPAVMCSETLWWRCHRRLISDYLVAVRGVAVTHLLPGPSMRPHVAAAGARLTAAGLVYDLSGEDGTDQRPVSS
jgi:uncharacterized protein (DUF488 family)